MRTAGQPRGRAVKTAGNSGPAAEGSCERCFVRTAGARSPHSLAGGRGMRAVKKTRSVTRMSREEDEKREEDEP
eukprot:scaffold640_cov126-Isochrysis_galbana.AAC.3